MNGLPALIFIAAGLFNLSLQGRAEALAESFEKIWNVAQENIYPIDRQAHFSDERHAQLKRQLNGTKSLQELAAVVNPFLDQLKVSHTRLYAEPDPDYYFFRSLFATHYAESPKVFHVGGQFLRASNGTWLVKAVLDGFPLYKAGLRRGDHIVEVNGKTFHPIVSFTGKKSASFALNGTGGLIS